MFVTFSIGEEENKHLIVNSEDWKDVYSTLIFGAMKGIPADFLVSTNHGPVLLNEINKKKQIEVITSKKDPFVVNYLNIIRSRGFVNPTEKIVDNANMDLLNELPDVENYIVIGDYYGYNAIAVAPYALLTNSWVIIANRENIIEWDTILSKRKVNKMIIYGYTDREVKETFQKYNPRIINNLDRFKDNIEIVEEFIKKKNTTQVILSNGEFIEKGLIQKDSPILFTGKENVPNIISDYIKKSDINIGVLVGNDLINAATNIRRTTGISVIVKFARSARGQTGGGVAAVENLDLFPIPSPYLSLKVHNLRYNKALNQLEVTYRSDSNVPAYLQGTINLQSGTKSERVGDKEAVFIAPKDYKTLKYKLNSNFDEKLIAELNTLYGETPNSFDRVIRETLNVSIVNVIDSSEIEICESCVSYSIPKKEFRVRVKNIGVSDVWVDIEIENIKINSVLTTLSSENAVLIEKGKTKDITIKQRLDETDIDDNPFINVIANYGEKEDSLVKELRGKFKLNLRRYETINYLIAIILLLILIIIGIIIKKKIEEREL